MIIFSFVPLYLFFPHQPHCFEQILQKLIIFLQKVQKYNESQENEEWEEEEDEEEEEEEEEEDGSKNMRVNMEMSMAQVGVCLNRLFADVDVCV